MGGARTPGARSPSRGSAKIAVASQWRPSGPHVRAVPCVTRVTLECTPVDIAMSVVEKDVGVHSPAMLRLQPGPSHVADVGASHSSRRRSRRYAGSMSRIGPGYDWGQRSPRWAGVTSGGVVIGGARVADVRAGLCAT